MSRLREVLAFINNKGGVGKTTTVQNTAAGLLEANPDFRILCIDLDPQGNLSSLLGWHEHSKEVAESKTIDMALRNADHSDLGMPVYKSSERLFYCPASRDLAEIDPDLHRQMSSKMVLNDLFGTELQYMEVTAEGQQPEIAGYVEDNFDYVLIDCAPALSELTYNALGASTGVVIPVQLGALSVDGIAKMIEAYRNVRAKLNKDLVMRGLLIVMADERTNMARETIKYLRESYDEYVFDTRIRQCVKVGESQFLKQDIFEYAPDCTAGQDYASFVGELLNSYSEEE